MLVSKFYFCNRHDALFDTNINTVYLLNFTTLDTEMKK